MQESRKLRVSIYLSILLILSIVIYNIFDEYLETHLFAYLKRRIYYEQTISKKDLSRHPARYWRKVR
jgi:hypothetical protein